MEKGDEIRSLCHCPRVPAYSSPLSQKMPRMNKNKTSESSWPGRIVHLESGLFSVVCVYRFGSVQPGSSQRLRLIGTRLRSWVEHTLRLPLKCLTSQMTPGIMATSLCSAGFPLCLNSSEFLYLLIFSYHLEDCSLLVGYLLSQSTSSRKPSW